MRPFWLIAAGLATVLGTAGGFAQPAPAPPSDPAPPAAPTAELSFLAKPDEPDKVKLEGSHEHGLVFSSADGQFRFHAGGVGQIDSTWLVGPQGNFLANGGAANGVGNSAATQLRRAILQIDGTVYGQFDFMIQYDFANASDDNSGVEPPSFGDIRSSPAPQNIWMQIRDLPVLGSVRIGNQVKPIGMANNTPAQFLSFMERPDNHDAFYGPFDNGYSLGVSVRDMAQNERATWQYGIYRPAVNVFGVALNKASYGGRATALPVYEDDGEKLIHIGFGTFNGELVEDELRVRARPLLRNGPGFAVPILVDTGEVTGSRQYSLAPEFAAVLGSLTVQAEWTGQFLTAADPSHIPLGTVFFHGGYIEALYFLTGEHDQYDKRDGSFGRVIPRSNFQTKPGEPCRGFGAWQLGVRFSYLDLTDKAIQGGQLYDWTLGVNWYLNPNMKVQFNCIAEHRDSPLAGVDGWITGFGVRAGYDF
jgi:phosphate-selective porin OprO/OprP